MLRFLDAGESHGPALTVVVDGLPAGIPIDRAAIDADLRRRQGGYGRGGRMRIESDAVEILSGVRHGVTLGSPVALVVRNRDHENWREVMSADPQPPEARKKRALKYPRPGHADLAGALKYLTDDLRDMLERASARETASRVAAGALARALLATAGVEVRSHVLRIGEAAIAGDAVVAWDDLAAVEQSPVRCADAGAGPAMMRAIDAAKKAGNTLGGVFEVVAHGVPPGLGSFAQWDRRLDGRIAQALMSIQAVKAVAIGAGFDAGNTPGASFHDEIYAIGPDSDLRRHLVALSVQPVEQFALERGLADLAQIRHAHRLLAERPREVRDQAATQPVGGKAEHQAADADRKSVV